MGRQTNGFVLLFAAMLSSCADEGERAPVTSLGEISTPIVGPECRLEFQRVEDEPAIPSWLQMDGFAFDLAEEGRALPLSAEGRAALTAMADGDGRYLLNLSEELFQLTTDQPLGPADVAAAVQRRSPLYDKAQEGHYNLISALHKSLRGSDPDAALYWLARMLAGGEDPRYIARRLTRFAVEDVGLADPQALPQALAGWQAYERLGSPEGELALAQVVLYLATAPKSNRAYVALGAARRAAKETGSLMPPKHILNAPTRLMKDLGYGRGYEYDHDADDAFSGQNYFPDGMDRRSFYQPTDRGQEADLAVRLAEWSRLRARRDDG